jgi:hypothetical protein
MPAPFTIAVVAYGPSSGPWLRSWIEAFRRSGTTLPLVVLTDEEDPPPAWSVPEDLSVIPCPCPRSRRVGWIKAHAFHLVGGPVAVFELDALPVGSLDDIARTPGPVAMAQAWRPVHWPHFLDATQRNYGVIVVRIPEFSRRYLEGLATLMERLPGCEQLRFADELAASRAWELSAGVDLPVRWNWSHHLGRPPGWVSVVHYDGTHKAWSKAAP